MRGFLNQAARILRKPSKRGSQDLASAPCEVVDDEAAGAGSPESVRQRRPPQRRESTKLQSATRFLRSLRAGRGADAAADATADAGPQRASPHYHSQGKAGRRRAKQTKSRPDAAAERSHSFHDKVGGARPTQRSASEHRRHDSLDSDVTLSELQAAGDAAETDVTSDPAAGSIYENLSAGGRADLLSCSPAPLLRDRERRSARKLTKDSGYETSPYSEGDYTSLSLRSGSAETLTAEAPRQPLQQYLTEEYLTGVDTSRAVRAGPPEPARRSSLSEGSELGSVGSGSTLVAERSGEDARSSSSGGSRLRSPAASPDQASSAAAAARTADPAASSPQQPAGDPPSSLHRAGEQTSGQLLRTDPPRGISHQQQQHGVTTGMVYNFTAPAAAPPAASTALWDEERERQAYAAHLRSSSYQLHSRQRSALGSCQPAPTVGAGDTLPHTHSRQGSGLSFEDDTLSHASYQGLYYPADASRTGSGVASDCRTSAAGYPPEFRRVGSHDSLPSDVPPPAASAVTSLSDEVPDNVSQGDGESLTYDLDDIDRALASDVPERDPASLTHIRYGPGHEKYPSWPVPAAAEPESGPLSGGSYRSKSWTDATDYPKDRAAGYTRPHPKKSLSATFQQQLNTVMEKCERIGPETFLALEQRAKSDSPREEAALYPCMDRDGRELGDKDYTIPSPPERDYDGHSERRQTFAEDAGPRSLCTPFLDQLRRDIALSPVEDGEAGEASWSPEDRPDGDQQPRSGRDSVATVVTYSSSNSSNEAMRLYGSFSDISVVSSSTSRSDPHPDQQIAHSSRVRPPQRLLSENVLASQQPPPQAQKQRPEFKLAKSVDESLLNGTGVASQDATDSRASPKSQRSPTIDYSKPPSVTDRIKALESQSRESRRDLHSKSVPNLLADKWSWKNSSRGDSDGSRVTGADGLSSAAGVRLHRSGRSLDQTASDRDIVSKEADSERDRRRMTSRSVSSERCRVPTLTDSEKRRKSIQVNSQDTSTLKAIQKQAVMSYYERQMSRNASSPPASFAPSSPPAPHTSTAHSHPRSHNPPSQPAAEPQTSPQPQSLSHTSPPVDPRVPEKHERGYRAGPTLWRVPESLQPDSASARPRTSSGGIVRSRGPSRRSSSASDRTSVSTSTNSSNSSSSSHGSGRSGADSAEATGNGRKMTEAASAETAVTSLSSSVEIQPLSTQSASQPRSSSRDGIPPERPPKKPHLRPLSGGAAPQVATLVHQQLVAAAATPSGTAATSSQAAPPPRRPPKSPCIRKPAIPEPAVSSRSGAASPEPPPPPPPPPAVNESLSVSDEPLPPPPATLLEPAWSTSPPHTSPSPPPPPPLQAGAARQLQQSPPAAPPSPSAVHKGTYHKDSYMAHRREWRFGHEGRYRRTLSPSPPPPASQEAAPPPPPPASSPPAAIGRSVSYAAPRASEPSPVAKLKPSTSTGRLEATSARLEPGKVVRQPSTTVVFSDAELRAFRAREQRARELVLVPTSGTTPPPASDDHHHQESPEPPQPSTSPPHRSPSPPPAVYRSPMADAKSERFPAYKKYSEIKPNCKPVVSPPASLLMTSSVMASSVMTSSDVIADETGEDAAPPRTVVESAGDDRAAAAVEEEQATSAATATLGRRSTPEEIECDRLSRAFVSRAAVDNKLQSLLVPRPDHRTTTHYIQGLFDLPLTQAGSRPPTHTNGVTPLAATTAQSPVASPDKPGPETSPLRPDSAYFTTSASKAKFLAQYSRDLTSDRSLKNVTNVEEVRRQQEELVSRISRKLEILREEQQSVRQEVETNAALGESVAARVHQLATPVEHDKFASFVDQIGTITSLLLGLSGRLARAENALASLDQEDAEERANLEQKRDKLTAQLDEARNLKESVDRRSRQVAATLAGFLSQDELSDYNHFIQMKAKLIIDSREIDDKLRLGQEQLDALTQAFSGAAEPPIA